MSTLSDRDVIGFMNNRAGLLANEPRRERYSGMSAIMCMRMVAEVLCGERACVRKRCYMQFSRGRNAIFTNVASLKQRQ